MMTLTEPATIASKRSTGALDALANYWIKKAHFENINETEALPECNLDSCASQAFGEFLLGQEIDPSVAFEAGLAVAAILYANPLDPGDAIRELLQRTVDEAAASGRPRREVLAD
jgi:hypothetical protein